jgi:hypothetical protein
MKHFAQLNSTLTTAGLWLTSHPIVLRAVVAVAIVLVFTLAASSVAYAEPFNGGGGTGG